MRTALALAACLMVATVGQAQPPDLDELLDRTADYVATYRHDFAGIVADETYRQEARGSRGTDLRGFPIEASRQKRDLKSDVLFVRTPDADYWMQFRDVYEVDGKPVRDRAERLTKLFLEPSRSVTKQAEDISTESARYNIGGVNRNINLPVLALSVLETRNRPWVVFSGSRKKDVWEVEFREERGGTLIRTTGNQSMPSRGHFLIDGATGRVLSSELMAESSSLRARIDVTYAPEASLGGLLVPSVMREKYDLKDGSVIEGRASYGRFRRYQVQTDEKIALAAQPAPSLATVLERAGTYVLELQRQLAGIVAEEDYVQDVKVANGFPSTTRSGLRVVSHRELKSDLLLVRPVGADRWMQFRDVFEVDGRPVRDRNERLMKLFVTPSSSTANQADQIASESSRYNIGNLQRTVNLPVLALAVLEPRGQPRFVFKRIEKGGQVPVRSAPAAAKTVWVIGYREVEGQTMIRTTNFRDLPARGRFWIEPESGEVLATELIAEDLSVRGEIAVGYEREPTLNVMVPIHMKERYDLRRGPSPVTGEANYRSFRQFQVKVDEKIAPIKERENW